MQSRIFDMNMIMRQLNDGNEGLLNLRNSNYVQNPLQSMLRFENNGFNGGNSIFGLN